MTAARADQAVAQGMELVGIVRDYGVDTVTAWIRKHDRASLEALCVALAAMVPDDKTPSQLLGWLDLDAAARQKAARERQRRLERRLLERGAPVRTERVHGTHGAFNTHRKKGEAPCDLCVAAERIYQRERYRRKRGVA